MEAHQGNIFEEFFAELFGPTRDAQRRVDAKTGDRVLLHGLGREDLNGRFATVLDPRAVRGRYHIRLEDTGAEIRARSLNFTKIVAAPAEVVDLDEEGIDTSTLLHGSCSICLTEKARLAAIPCGHLAFCSACAPRAGGTCPICRRRLFSLLRVYTPGSTGAEELEKAIERCRTAEKRVKELEAEQSPPKRSKRDGDRQRRPTSLKTRHEGHAIEVGSWVRMPKLSALRQTARSPNAEFSQLVGQVVAVEGAATCTIRFSGVDAKTYVETGKKEPGDDYKDMKMALETPFKCVYTVDKAEWALVAQDRYCVFAAMKMDRQRKLRAERRAKEKQGSQ